MDFLCVSIIFHALDDTLMHCIVVFVFKNVNRTVVKVRKHWNRNIIIKTQWFQNSSLVISSHKTQILHQIKERIKEKLKINATLLLILLLFVLYLYCLLLLFANSLLHHLRLLHVRYGSVRDVETSSTTKPRKNLSTSASTKDLMMF